MANHDEVEAFLALATDLQQQISHLQPIDQVMVAQEALALALLQCPAQSRFATAGTAMRLLVSRLVGLREDLVSVTSTLHTPPPPQQKKD